MIVLGERIKELRRRDGRTQEALASELGVTAQAVSRWEKGICCPDMELIPSIANFFCVSIDELFGYDFECKKTGSSRINGGLREKALRTGAPGDLPPPLSALPTSLS